MSVASRSRPRWTGPASRTCRSGGGRTALDTLVPLVAVLVLVPCARAGKLAVPADFPTIQAAVDAALPGDEIVVAKGVYAENVVVAQSNLLLSGKGAVIDGGYAGPCIDITADLVGVRGFRLLNGQPGLRADGDTILIQDNDVRAASGPGLQLQGDSAVVFRNKVSGCSGHGIESAASTTASAAVFGLNTVSACGGDGLRLGPSGDFFVAFNRCRDNAGDGLHLEVATTGPGGSLVGKNRCERNAQDGLDVVADGSLQIVVNWALGNGAAGIRCASASPFGGTNSIEANRCLANVTAGIDVTGGASVRNNRCTDNRLAGLQSDFADSVLGSSVIDGNTLARNGRDGVRAVGGSTALIENVCVANLGDGIDLDDSASDYALVRNGCRQNRHEGIDNSGIGTSCVENVALKNGSLDIAGAGNAGVGSVTSLADSTFGTGGETDSQILDL